MAAIPMFVPVIHFDSGVAPFESLHPGVWQSLQPAKRIA